MRTRLSLFLVPLVVLFALGGAAALIARSIGAESNGDLAQLAMYDSAPAAGETETAKAAPLPQVTPALAPAPAGDAAMPAPAGDAAGQDIPDVHVVVRGDDPKMPRSVGKGDAPVTLYMFSSLTCPHCADAHKTVLPRLIKDYVEPGKLRIVFADFPLNQQALDASKVSRCVANDQYYGFISLLFGSIEQWAYSNRHPDALIGDAVLTGLSDARARACLNDKSLEQALIEGVQDAAAKYKVDATPTFVFNDGARTLSGARPYDEFKKTIDDLLAVSGH